MKTQSDLSPKEKYHYLKNYLKAEVSIGQGAQGSIYLFQNQFDKELYVLKAFNKKEDFENEEKMLNQIKNLSHCVQMVYSSSDFNDKGSCAIVMKFYKKLNLLKYVKDNEIINEKIVKNFFHQLIDGVSLIHSKGIAHLDLKLENILLDEKMQIFIADFGLSKNFANKEEICTNYWAGTRQYCLPEIQNKNHYKYVHADIYSAGIVLFYLYARILPFQKNSSYDQIHMRPQKFWEDAIMMSQNNEFKLSINDSFKDLFQRMIHRNPSQRIELEQIKQHPWYLE